MDVGEIQDVAVLLMLPRSGLAEKEFCVFKKATVFLPTDFPEYPSMETAVIKVGGSTLDAPEFLGQFARSMRAASRECYPIVVHGGGRDIARQLDLLDKKYTFVEGMRVTDEETMKSVQMVLSGDVNKRIVNTLLTEGVPAVGLSGVDGGLFEAEKMMPGGRDIGFVGRIIRVNGNIVDMCRKSGAVVVISPVSRSANGDIYNVNADIAAGELAVSLSADHLIFISDVPGVKVDNAVQREIKISEVEELISDGQVTGGMCPKVRSAVDAVSRGVKRVHICAWHGQDTLTDELSTATARGSVIHA